MWNRFRQWIKEKVDVKVTGYLCVGIFGLTLVSLMVLIGLSVSRDGALPRWSAAGGFAIMLVNAWNILLARWGQQQTGRKLRWNKAAVILSGGMIGVMAAIYILGVI